MSGVVWKEKKWSLMRRSSKKQPQSLKQSELDQHDSPTIQNLIEQLERDVKESERSAAKAQ